MLLAIASRASSGMGVGPGASRYFLDITDLREAAHNARKYQKCVAKMGTTARWQSQREHCISTPSCGAAIPACAPPSNLTSTGAVFMLQQTVRERRGLAIPLNQTHKRCSLALKFIWKSMT